MSSPIGLRLAMPKKRSAENKGYPAGWRKKHGALFYRVPKGMEGFWDNKTEFRLGKTAPEAYRVWADRIGGIEGANTIAELLDRYALEIIPTNEPRTQTEKQRHVKLLRAVFGNMPLNSIKPIDVYKYVDKRGARVSAQRDIATLSHAYTKAVEWGYIHRHPFKGEVRFEGEKPRDRYVEDWEILECLSLSSKRKKGSVKQIQAYLRLKLLTGMDRSDLLRLREENIKDDGIHNNRHKVFKRTGKRTIYEWTPELREAVALVRETRPLDNSPWLFCTRRGNGYINEKTGDAQGWASIWQRFMDRVLKETKVKERFTDRDIRAKAGSDAESLEHARALLAHSDSRTTKRVYRRKPERVKPV